MKQQIFIPENGGQFDITEIQAKELVKNKLIYNTGEGYYNLECGISFTDIKFALKAIELDLNTVMAERDSLRAEVERLKTELQIINYQIAAALA